MIKKFKGVLEFGDPCRCDSDINGAFLIGDVDVLDELGSTHFDNPVTVAVADKRFSGELNIELGWGYSEYTPMDDDKMEVGEHNIVGIIGQYEEGQELTLWVADEPVNVLA